MPRRPVARDKLLAAFEQIVLDDGERAATLDAVAAAAGVSKGGLLYHFPHRQALVDATLQQLDRALVVASRLVQSGDENARAALKRLEQSWYALILADVGDPVVATAVQQMGDGLYHNASIGLLPDAHEQRHAILIALLEAVDRLCPRP